jgi:hypothetical protein
MAATQRIKELQTAGFNDAEIAEWSTNERKTMSEAGFAEHEIDAWFGKPQFNPKPMAAEIKANLDATREGAEPKPVKDFTEALEAGWQISVSGLLARGQTPDKTVAGDAPMTSRIAGQVATLVGDFPAMVGGFLAGGAAGGPAAPVTATAGAFALPAGLRATLMDAYEKGNFDNFGDFWDRASGIFIDTAKGWLTGAATGAAGKAIPAALPAASPSVRAAATVSGEVVTMVTVGKALEGEIPSAQDFLDAAVVIGGLKGTAYTAGKLRNVYSKTGVRPADIAADIRNDPTIAQDLLSDNVEIPRAYGGKPGEPVEAPKAAEPKPAPEPAAGSIEAAQTTVLKKISVGDHTPTEKLTFERLYTMAVDDLNPIKQAVKEMTPGEKLPTAEDPYQLARLTRGTFGKADQFLEHGTYDFKTLETTGKGLKQILEPVADDLNGLRAYAASRRAVELGERGIESGIDTEAAKQVVKSSNSAARYEPVLRELVDYQNRLVGYLRDAGVLSKPAYDAMLEANKNYVPFFRVMDDGAGGAGAGKGLSTRDPIKAIRGSERDIIDPLESVIKNTYLYLSLAERNAVGVKFVELANKSGVPDQFITKVNPPIRATTVAEPEMVKFLEAHGIDKVPDELLTVFRAARAPLAENEIAVFEQGKRTVYEVQPDVARAFKGMDTESVNLLVKVLAVPARALRAGSVLSPDFMARNVTRDFMSAFVNSKGIFSPLDTMRGVFELVRRGDDFQNWLKSGGANSTLVALDRQYLQENVFKLSEDAGLGRRAWNVVSSPLEILRVTSELLENSTRLGEFKKVAGGSTDKADLQAAGMASREVTLDFARIGTNMRALNMISTFLNAHVQGLDRVAREIGDRPANFGVKVAVGITVPSILLWNANKDDPRWEEIPRWQKDLFWIVMTKDHIYRIPKPHELGVVFGSVPERLLESYYKDNPTAFKDLEKTLMQAFVPDMMPTVAVPMIEQMANRSLFTGNPIVPAHLEKLLPEYQYNEYTTEATKALGALIGAFPGMKDRSIDDQDTTMGGTARALTTPVLIENYVRGWTGGLGMYALKLADGLLREAGVLPDPVMPAKTLADLPVVRAFVMRYPSATAQSIQDFYDKFYANKKVFDTVMAKAAEGDAEAVEKTQGFRPEAMVQLDGIREALTTHSQVIRMVHKNPDISADEKRQLIDSYYFRMIELAKAGNEALGDIEKTVGKGVAK